MIMDLALSDLQKDKAINKQDSEDGRAKSRVIKGQWLLSVVGSGSSLWGWSTLV